MRMGGDGGIEMDTQGKFRGRRDTNGSRSDRGGERSGKTQSEGIMAMAPMGKVLKSKEEGLEAISRSKIQYGKGENYARNAVESFGELEYRNWRFYESGGLTKSKGRGRGGNEGDGKMLLVWTGDGRPQPYILGVRGKNKKNRQA